MELEGVYEVFVFLGGCGIKKAYSEGEGRKFL
jgi:hypothetical protein